MHSVNRSIKSIKSINCDHLPRYTEWWSLEDKIHAVAEELYDHTKDPFENLNVTNFSEYKEIKSMLNSRLHKGWRVNLKLKENKTSSKGHKMISTRIYQPTFTGRSTIYQLLDENYTFHNEHVTCNVVLIG